MKTTRNVLLTLLLPALAACGVKGPLVLPGKATPARTVEPIELPRDADATRDQPVESAEPADAAEPVAPPTEE